MSIVISAENIGKKYIIGHQKQDKYETLGATLTHLGRSLIERVRHPLSPNREDITLEEFWALKDINFKIKQGDRVGIIGRNGAGKSTLLKVLSRITEPTTGRIKIKGRVASLLEVGTGFHPELSGRENIFLNGAILGMSKAEIRHKFDEIVDFAGVEKFLDTPVKRYSSGMYVRLAFSVAAHLEPDIFIVDEVLAVGDAAFQKKCLGKMGEIGKEGRTVIFVSHNMQAVKKVCDTGLLLNQGKVEFINNVDKTVARYLSANTKLTVLDDINAVLKNIKPDPVFCFTDIILSQNGNIVDLYENGNPILISVKYEVYIPTAGLRIYFDLCDFDENIIFRSFNDEQNKNIEMVQPGKYISAATIPSDFLAPKEYKLFVRATIYNERTFEPKEGLMFVIKVERTGKVNTAYASEPIRGKIAPYINWDNSCEAL